MGLINLLKKINHVLNVNARQEEIFEEQKLLMGKILIELYKQKKDLRSLKEVEFKVFSQWGDDGIIQWLINNLDIPNHTFIEFGVEDYSESNTRFLMINNNWSGLVMDGSAENIARIKQSNYFWKFDLVALPAFVHRDNVNQLISSRKFDPEVGILHIDIDGNDYWIWEKIDVINPVIVIMEYNSLFGKDRAITIPYKEDFDRTEAHHSNLYFGASLKALYLLAKKKGYTFVGCNSNGVNSYFVRNDKLNDVVKEMSFDKGFVESKDRQSRDEDGNLNFLPRPKQHSEINGMPVYNVETDETEEL